MEYINYKIIIVGAGAAGIGNAFALLHLGLTEKDFLILEQNEIGSSFKKWPKEMRFITPSFIGNQFGAVDLNAVTHNTSPAFALHKEHPNGKEYASYLECVVDHFKLPVRTGVKVSGVKKEDNLFHIRTDKKTYRAEFLIWCGGEFQFPKLDPFKGSKYCIHNSQIKSYANLKGENQIIIGGYESGVDAAVNLSKLGKKSVVLDSGKRWDEFSSDPSAILSTYTYERLQNELPKQNIDLLDHFEVQKIIKKRGAYTITSTQGEELDCLNPPILCTGFKGSVSLIENLFELTEKQDIALTENDESTKTKNLFLSGPMVRQKNVIFCFIYKFRQRFPVIAKEIGKRLGVENDTLDSYKRANMYMDDLSCCDEECAC